MNMQSLLQKRAQFTDLLEQLYTKAVNDEGDPVDLSPEETQDEAEYKSQIKTLDRRIEQLKGLQESKAESAKPLYKDDTVDDITNEPNSAPKKVPAEPKPSEMKGQNFVTFVKCIGMARNNLQYAASLAENTFKNLKVAKTILSSSHDDGGAVVPGEFTQEIIELLRPRSVIMSMNPVVLPFNGSLTMPRQTGGASASYIGEAQPAGVTGQTFGTAKFTERKLAALVPISNDFIRNTQGIYDNVIRRDLVTTLAQRADLAFIRGEGTDNSPRGLRYWAPAANVIAANATFNEANATKDLGLLELALQNANVAMTNPGWLMAPRVEKALMDLRVGDVKAYPEMADGRLRGKPYRTTTQIPWNLGGGGDESEIYLADFDDVVIAEVPEMIVSMSSEASYVSGGATVSAFQNDLTLMIAIQRHDMNLRHLESVAVLNAVTWGG